MGDTSKSKLNIKINPLFEISEDVEKMKKDENFGMFDISIKGTLTETIALELVGAIEKIMNKYGKSKTIEKDSDSEEREKARSKR